MIAIQNHKFLSTIMIQNSLKNKICKKEKMFNRKKDTVPKNAAEANAAHI